MYTCTIALCVIAMMVSNTMMCVCPRDCGPIRWLTGFGCANMCKTFETMCDYA